MKIPFFRVSGGHLRLVLLDEAGGKALRLPVSGGEAQTVAVLLHHAAVPKAGRFSVRRPGCVETLHSRPPTKADGAGISAAGARGKDVSSFKIGIK